MNIKSNYQKTLSFVVNEKPFSIKPSEIKRVDDEIGEKLIKTAWISEVKTIKFPIGSFTKGRIKIRKTRKYVKHNKNRKRRTSRNSI